MITEAILKQRYQAIRAKLYAPRRLRRKTIKRYVVTDSLVEEVRSVSSGPRWRQVVSEVAALHGATFADLIGASRKQKFHKARQEAIRRILEEITIDGKPPSSTILGRWFNRDHTSILHIMGRTKRK